MAHVNDTNSPSYQLHQSSASCTHFFPFMVPRAAVYRYISWHCCDSSRAAAFAAAVFAAAFGLDAAALVGWKDSFRATP